MKRGKYIPWVFLAPTLIFIGIFVYIPIIQNFYFSFFRMNSYSVNTEFLGLKNYLDIFNDDVFYTAIINNCWYAVISLTCQVGFGLMIAIFVESKFLSNKAKQFFRTIYFIPSVIAITAVGLAFYFIYNPTLGLLNSVIEIFIGRNFDFAWLGNPKTAIFAIIAMSQWQWTGYIAMLLIVAIQRIPVELYESADLDGANFFQKAIYVTIPQIREMLLVASVITVIGAFKLFAEVFVTTRGAPYGSSHVLGTYMYETAFFHDKMGYAAAIAAIIFIITFIASIIQIKIGGSEN
ncbi:sugar ABC transporter permease [Halocella sp. SP3-1]|uniref:carbohydrate ABC transporter permease n=1 Tax=Halocella sp. SP3-1 TaxID=2382161 RepID=UPI002570B917|nr:sugar ABC transporter permease [Halocella sp. SP3-1]